MELYLFNVLVIAAHQRICSISKEHLPTCSPTDFFTTVGPTSDFQYFRSHYSH